MGWASAVRCAVAALCGALLVGCGGTVGTSGSLPDSVWGEPGWGVLPAAPLAAREGAVGAWTGREAVFLGGSTAAPCPPGASCEGGRELRRDGAVFDPVERAWRRTAAAPAPLGFVQPAVLGDRVYALTDGEMLVYDVSDDAWQRQPSPGDKSLQQLVAAGDELLAISSGDEAGERPDQLFDPESGTWRDLPDDPLGLSFDRRGIWTPHGLVLTAHQMPLGSPREGPSFVVAAVLDLRTRRWRELPTSDQIGGWGWAWTGRRLVDPTPGGADGGQVDNYGRQVPFGGILTLPDGTWQRLPAHTPSGPTPAGWYELRAAGGRWSAVNGWLYDDQHESWAVLPRPDGGPDDPGSAVWAGSTLLILGGAHYDGRAAPLSATAWSYQAAS